MKKYYYKPEIEEISLCDKEVISTSTQGDIVETGQELCSSVSVPCPYDYCAFVSN